MKPKEILCQWVNAFNNADTETIANLYDDNAINHQVVNEAVVGKETKIIHTLHRRGEK